MAPATPHLAPVLVGSLAAGAHVERFFGTADGVRVGRLFVNRRELHEAFVHRPTQAGISGTKAEGADSIVVSGGYIDDEDHGDYIISAPLTMHSST